MKKKWRFCFLEDVAIVSPGSDNVDPVEKGLGLKFGSGVL